MGENKMTTGTTETSPLISAKLAGFFYLIQVLLYIFSSLIVPEGPSAIINNIRISESLLRLSIVGILLAQIVGIVYVLFLYKLLKPVNKNIAALMLLFALTVPPITMLNELTRLGILQVVGGAAYLSAFTTEQLEALAHFFIRLHDEGTSISLIFAGLWLFPLGYLVFQSRFLPRILGVLLVFAGFGYLIYAFGSLLSSDYNLRISLLAGLAEVLLLLWLLIKGVNVEQWNKR
ncbi:MAG TPA: DUF4386 domain-containing protein, partial [Anaerolineales bacterium]|nr:DUF4386 domain-containing protein [Anaerolineales bacterium]